MSGPADSNGAQARKDVPAREGLKVGPGWFVVEKAGKTYVGLDPSYSEEEGAPAEDDPEVLGTEGVMPDEPEPDDAGLTLNPCYEVQRVLMNHNGQQGVAVNVNPYGFFSDPVDVTFPDPDVVVHVGDMSENDRQMIVNFVKLGEKARLDSRAARAGIVPAQILRG